MHQDKLVFAIKVNGKVLREFKDTVYIPFGSEYTLYIKNLNTTRAQIKINLDGKSISDDNEYIVNANSVLEIERFLTSGNLHTGNKFKFIERTAGVEAHRGINAEDGLIHVEYEFERPVPQLSINADWITGNHNKFIHNISSPVFYGDIATNSTNRSMFTMATPQATSALLASGSNVCGANASATVGGMNIANETGITVPGSKSSQQFSHCAAIRTDGVKHSMVIKLLGAIDDVPVVKPTTVKQKPKCQSCGRLNKINNKFCSDCGTSLEIFN